jgi:hypothetical protein
VKQSHVFHCCESDDDDDNDDRRETEETTALFPVDKILTLPTIKQKSKGRFGPFGSNGFDFNNSAKRSISAVQNNIYSTPIKVSKKQNLNSIDSLDNDDVTWGISNTPYNATKQLFKYQTKNKFTCCCDDGSLFNASTFMNNVLDTTLQSTTQQDILPFSNYLV